MIGVKNINAKFFSESLKDSLVDHLRLLIMERVCVNRKYFQQAKMKIYNLYYPFVIQKRSPRGVL